MNQFRTIRQTAAMGVLPEHRIRILVAQKDCPGFYAGNRFLVNVDLLIEQLNRQSTEATNKGAC